MRIAIGRVLRERTSRWHRRLENILRPGTKYKVRCDRSHTKPVGEGGHLINSERWPGQWSQLSSDQIWSEVPLYFRITAAAVERGIAGFGIGEVGLFLLYK